MSVPRLAGAVLCAAASLLLLVSSAQMFAGEAAGWGAGLLLVAGVGLFVAALKSVRSPRRSG
ncbi:MAG TPA: hypothetical protein VF588_16750 [Pyrinomonadaceae bacterium]|jgi:hypothetical protein